MTIRRHARRCLELVHYRREIGEWSFTRSSRRARREKKISSCPPNLRVLRVLRELRVKFRLLQIARVLKQRHAAWQRLRSLQLKRTFRGETLKQWNAIADRQ